MPTREELKVGQEERIRSYYQAISAKGKEVMREKRAQGEIMHKAPLGYKNARDEDGRSVMMVNEKEAELIQQILSLFNQSHSYRSIASTLSKLGCTTRTGRPLSAMFVMRVVKQHK